MRKSATVTACLTCGQCSPRHTLLPHAKDRMAPACPVGALWAAAPQDRPHCRKSSPETSFPTLNDLPDKSASHGKSSWACARHSSHSRACLKHLLGNDKWQEEAQDILYPTSQSTAGMTSSSLGKGYVVPLLAGQGQAAAAFQV